MIAIIIYLNTHNIVLETTKCIADAKTNHRKYISEGSHA